MRRKSRVFHVTLDIPEGAAEEDVMNYLADAVKTWRGQLFPGTLSAFGHDTDEGRDPMYDLDESSVRVGLNTYTRSYRKTKKWTRVGLTPPSKNRLRKNTPLEE